MDNEIKRVNYTQKILHVCRLKRNIDEDATTPSLNYYYTISEFKL
jgi:hypothetical protein